MGKKLIIVIQLFFILLTLNNYLFPLTESVNCSPIEVNHAEKLVIILVDSTYYTSLQESLNQLRNDLENDGWNVEIISTKEISSEDPASIREYFCTVLNRNLKGALLIGDIPTAWVRVKGRSFPTDMYYMDLDGLWIDEDKDGLFDKHLGDIEPEIWIGRICPLKFYGIETPIKQVKNYLSKVHKYRHGFLALPSRALAYLDDEAVEWADDVKNSLKKIAKEVTVVCDPSITNATDFKYRLKDLTGFQWLYLMSHGEIGYNCFYEYKQQNDRKVWQGAIYSTEYSIIDPRIMFYILFTCSSARYTDNDYLAGALIFKTTFGLVSISSTDLIFSMSLGNFFSSLLERKCIGDSFKNWLTQQLGEFKSQNYSSAEIMQRLYGLIIIGDPTLCPLNERNLHVHDVAILSAEFRIKENGDATLILKIKNKGFFTESLQLSIEYYSLNLLEEKITLEANESKTIIFTITYPYKLEKQTETVAREIKIEISANLEEYNAADNFRYVTITGVIIKKISPKTFPLLSRIVILMFATIITPYLFVKSLGFSLRRYKRFGRSLLHYPRGRKLEAKGKT